MEKDEEKKRTNIPSLPSFRYEHNRKLEKARPVEPVEDEPQVLDPIAIVWLSTLANGVSLFFLIS